MRAAIAARTVDGNSPIETSSATEATSSSRNSGFPSAVLTSLPIADTPAAGRSAVATDVASASLRGSSGSVVCPIIPPPQVRPASRNSGRASAMTTSLASRTWVTR